MIKKRIPSCKRGNCVRCKRKKTFVRKRQKKLLCLLCIDYLDTQTQLQKKGIKPKKPVKKKQVSTEEQEFWSNAETEMQLDPHCRECESHIEPWQYRSATAHIFPKSLFKSVRWHKNNWIPLPAQCCHDKTHTLAKLAKMKIFPLAVERFKTFRHLITENHKYKDEFIKHATEQGLL